MNNLINNMLRITTGFLNTVDDAVPGEVVAGTLSLPKYSGLLGGMLFLSHVEAARVSKTTIGTLYGGTYQYVKFKAGSTAANARGGVVYWDDPINYVVTPDAPAVGARLAGIGLSVNAKGNYGFIQTQGLAGVLFRSSITKTTPVIDDTVVVTVSAATADVLADATALTSANVKLILGVAHEAPANSSVKLVQLWSRFINL